MYANRWWIAIIALVVGLLAWFNAWPEGRIWLVVAFVILIILAIVAFVGGPRSPANQRHYGDGH